MRSLPGDRTHDLAIARRERPRGPVVVVSAHGSPPLATCRMLKHRSEFHCASQWPTFDWQDWERREIAAGLMNANNYRESWG